MKTDGHILNENQIVTPEIILDSANIKSSPSKKSYSIEEIEYFFCLFQSLNNVYINNAVKKKESISTLDMEETNLPSLKEGSISKRKDGRWHGKYWDNGIRKNIYAHSKKEIIIKLNKAIEQRNYNKKSFIVSKNISLYNWAVKWFETFKKSKVKKSTMDDYKSNLINKLKADSIGKKTLQKITALDLELFLQRINAPSSKARTYRQLVTCFNSAYNHKIIKDNPMLIVDRISEPKSKKTWPSQSDFFKLFEYTKKQNYDIYLFIRFLSLTGLRKGEALALTWLDIQDDRIHVNKAYEVHAKTVQTPKTENSIRTIPIFSEVQEILNKLDKNSTLLFSKIYRNAISKRLRIYNKRIGTNITLHTFRHYFTTQCLEAGINLKTVNSWTGHTSSKVTIGSYTHTNPEFESQELDKITRYRMSNKKYDVL